MTASARSTRPPGTSPHASNDHVLATSVAGSPRRVLGPVDDPRSVGRVHDVERMEVQVDDAITCRSGPNRHPLGCLDRAEAAVKICEELARRSDTTGCLAGTSKHVGSLEPLHHEPPVARVEDARRGVTVVSYMTHDLGLADERAAVSSPAHHASGAVLEDL